ncbi:MAG: ATP-binding protein [Mariprofundaceae bacterium]|nr:ATP-binding protein [Mariprofundaceae bacterium]
MQRKHHVDVSDLPLALLLLNQDWTISFANNLAEQLLQTSLQRLLGMDLTLFFEPREALLALKERAQGIEMDISDHTLRLKLGHTPLSMHLRRSDDQVCLLLIPETNRMNVEQQNKRHEMSLVVSRIALEMAHEIKNPLAALRGVCQWVSEHPLQQDLQEAMQQVMGNVDRIAQRVDYFLQLGPRADMAMQDVNIHSLLNDVMHTVPDGVKIHRVYDPSLPVLQAHPQRLRQAIENLWQNALEAKPQYIEWQTRLATATSLPQHKGMVLEVKIVNDGQSIPKSLQGSLFEPFVTAKKRGSGLGLAVVQQIMLEHLGRVHFTAENGRSCFFLHLPLLHSQ